MKKSSNLNDDQKLISIIFDFLHKFYYCIIFNNISTCIIQKLDISNYNYNEVQNSRLRVEDSSTRCVL